MKKPDSKQLALTTICIPRLHPMLKKQSGAVMAVSLIILLLLTLIGLTGMQTTVLEEKMASNSRDQNVAFQAAEAALRGGEAQLQNIASLNAFDGTNGLLGIDDAMPDIYSSSTWSDSQSLEFGSGISVATEPRFVIKHLKTEKSEDLNGHGYGGSGSASIVPSYFTVTVRGTGGQDTSQIFLRSHYAKAF